MSTQVNFHVMMHTTDSRAAKIVEEHSDFLTRALYTALNNVLADHGLNNHFLLNIRGPEIAELIL